MEVEIESHGAHVSCVDDPDWDPEHMNINANDVIVLEIDLTYIIAIIDRQPRRHNMSAATTIAHTAPIMRKMPARTVRAVGT